MDKISELLKIALDRNASDLHIRVGSPPIIRIDGHLVPLSERPRMAQEEVTAIIKNILSPPQTKEFARTKELDSALGVPGLGRFRLNVFMQRGTVGLVLRVIPRDILTIEQLNLPEVMEQIAMEPRGLILVTGTTGSGKTTTLASMIDSINRNRMVHIITIEDPIEFLHRDKKGIVDQREVGSDTRSFADALRAALRQDPDVILVGEMRDYDTIKTALMAAETGHLVFSTLHTTNAAESVNRVLSAFPESQQPEIRHQLSTVLRAVISLRLIPRADGKGRVPVAEIMIVTTTIKEAMLTMDKVKTIPDIIAASRSQYKMQTFDQSLFDLYEQGLVSYEEALRTASKPDDFALRVKGIHSTKDLTWEGEEEPPISEGGGNFEIERF